MKEVRDLIESARTHIAPDVRCDLNTDEADKRLERALALLDAALSRKPEQGGEAKP